jgi:hypothetical protein
MLPILYTRVNVYALRSNGKCDIRKSTTRSTRYYIGINIWCSDINLHRRSLNLAVKRPRHVRVLRGGCHGANIKVPSFNTINCIYQHYYVPWNVR